MTIHCMQVREMIRKSDQHRVPEVAHLLEGTVYDLPEHTVTVTDISEINLNNRSGASVNSDVKVKLSRLVFINSVLFVIPFSLIMTAPVYLSGLHHVYMYTSSRQLCFSSDSRTLCIPHVKTTTDGHSSFSCAASSVWNSLSPSSACS